MTRLLTLAYGSHLSTSTACGFAGNSANRSIMTLRGGGGRRLPDMVISLRPMGAGGCGGASRITSGSGVNGLAGC